MSHIATSRPPVGTIVTRAAILQPSSFNEADNSCEVIWTTGATVRRYDWIEGDYDETLATGPENVRLERLNGGGPVLANQDRSDLGSVVGSIVPGTARMQNGSGIARVRFASTADVADIVAKVRDGHIRSVSAGYIIHAYQVQEGEGRRAITVIDWEPIEISLVPVAADQGSFIRSEESVMSQTNRNNASTDQSDTNTAQPVTVRSIMTAVRNAGLDIAAADELINAHERSALTRDTLMGEIGRRFAARDAQVPTNGRVAPMQSPLTDHLRAMEDAIYCRMSGTAPTERAREFMGASMPHLARGLLEMRGENVRWQSDAQVIERALHTTSDFPQLLTAAGNRYLLDTFETAASAIKQVARERTANDFRDITNLKLSGGPALDKVNEHGEVKSGTFTDGGEVYRLATFAKIFGISRQALINDDLGAFSDPLRLMGRAAAETEATELTALLTANSGNGVTLADGNPLYHTSHGNKAASGAAIALASLATGRKAMRDQKDLDGKTPINSVPKFLLVGTDQETLAEQYIATLTPASADQANPFATKLTPLVDPRLPSLAWRLFADPALMPVIEYAYLTASRGPQLESRAGWNVLGTEFRVVLDFGCGVVDHRGTYLNPGA
ncbi:MAG: HK97 family phage prohead protease [Sphingomonadaceae bacterium]|nr:HK97 family phage prohead protease [Sphingomonadaceae bacterium]